MVLFQVGDFEYDLFLTSDTCTYRGRQWFYFQVSNMLAKVPYVFNIVNFDKINSQFNYGMQPVMFSTKEYLLYGSGMNFQFAWIVDYYFTVCKSSGWKRVGEKILYYGNRYTCEDLSKQYRSLMFCLTFNFSDDNCYLAYHYPYTYTRLMVRINTQIDIQNSLLLSRMS